MASESDTTWREVPCAEAPTAPRPGVHVRGLRRRHELLERLCCPPGMVGSDITCCPSGEVYYTGIGCRTPCAAGTEPCPIAGGCVTPTVCQKLNNGGGDGGNCAKTHSCS